jgi:hypothetical protein
MQRPLQVSARQVATPGGSQQQAVTRGHHSGTFPVTAAESRIASAPGIAGTNSARDGSILSAPPSSIEYALSGISHPLMCALRLALDDSAMNKLLLGFALAVLAAPPGAAQAQPQTGYWWNPAQSGGGFVIEIQGTSMFMAGFLYAANGEATWVASDGPMTTPTQYTGSVITFSGGQTLTGAYQSPTQGAAPLGNISINFTSDTTATVVWPGGTIPIQRFDIVPGGSTTQQPASNPQTGFWWNPTESGRGFTIEVQNGVMWFAGYMYDAQGNPVWYLANSNITSPTLFQGEWTQYANGQALGGPYKGPIVSNSMVGAATIQFTDSANAVLTLPDGRQIPFVRFAFGNVPGPAGSGWSEYARDAQHSAQGTIASQPLNRIIWTTPVDLAPQFFNGNVLLIHYGSPISTPGNTVLVPVKTAAQGSFRVDAHAGKTGAVLWSATSDYVLPPQPTSNPPWTPSFSPALTPANRVYFAGSGGKLFYRDNVDYASGTVNTAVFYGAGNYSASSAAYDSTIFVNTPITTDAQGNVFFGFIASGSNPSGLSSGIARIGADGSGSWAAASTLANNPSISKLAMNAAPALSPDQQTLYIAVNSVDVNPGGYSTGAQYGYLLALDSTTLAVKGSQYLYDPSTKGAAYVSDDASASPSVGPDGDVYYGVLESDIPSHNDRGWLLHFDAALSQVKIPGSFGWDDTASIVPASMVPSYKGSSTYLISTKYNNYAGSGTGNGQNRVAVLDPNATEADPISGNPVMAEVLTVLGVTADPEHPGGVREWCINSAAVDPLTKSILVNSEDGSLYRWDMMTNTLTQRVVISGGLGEAYTPTSIGPDGTVYAINNAMLFAVGQ